MPETRHEPGWTCPACHLTRGPDGHDPCIKNLPGVLYACCGHGGRRPGYIYFENGVVMRIVTRAVEYVDGHERQGASFPDLLAPELKLFFPESKT